MTKLMNVGDTKFSFYECVEAGDFENASAYFETLYFHYHRRGQIIKQLRKDAKEED